MEMYDLYRFDGRTIVAIKYPTTKAVTIIRDWTCDNVGAPSIAAADHAHAKRNATIVKLKVIAVSTAITVAALISSLISSFMTNLSPHPGEVPVFS